MGKFVAALICLVVSMMFLARQSLGEIIPGDRRIDWNQAGIPGGIPSRTTVCATIDAATYGSGAIDATAAIQAAINACPANQVVLIPAGVYALNTSGINLNKSVVLRGDGPSKTVLKSVPVNAINMGAFGNVANNYIDVVSGYAKGSSSMTLADASSVNIGDYYILSQENDYSIVDNVGVSTSCTWCSVQRCSSNHTIASPGWSVGSSCDNGNGVIEGGKRAVGQVLKITAKSGNIISFEQSLNWPYYSASLEPRILKINSMVEFAGVEDLKIAYSTTSAADGGKAISVNKCAHCWVRNVEFSGVPRRNIESYYAYRNEYRDNYIHDTYSMFSEPDHGYGILLMMYSTSNLAVNNILNNLEAQLVVEGGATGNVVAYNYVKDKSYYAPNWLMHTIASHAVHPSMNLLEGNFGQGGISADNIHGSASHQTYFRNRIIGYQEKAADGTIVKNGLWTVIIDQHNYYMNVVGNVLGLPGVHNVYEMEGVPSTNETKTIFRLGYVSTGDGTAEGNDPNVKTTLYRHGNYDTVTSNVLWDPAVSDHLLPASLYYSSRPAWWPSLAAWPPIGPDVFGGPGPGGHAYDIPAKVCYDNTPRDASNALIYDAKNCYSATPVILYGDVSENGSVTAYDASLAAQYAVGLITLTSTQFTKADVSCNGSISSYDASLIAQYAVGLITTLGCG